MATTRDIVGLQAELEQELAESAERHQGPGAAVGVALGEQDAVSIPSGAARARRSR